MMLGSPGGRGTSGSHTSDLESGETGELEKWAAGEAGIRGEG
jgi:hypothetical protein